MDGSAKRWVEAIEDASLVEAVNECGNRCEKLSPFLSEPVYVQKNDSFVAAFPSDKVCVTYGIEFSQVAFMNLFCLCILCNFFFTGNAVIVVELVKFARGRFLGLVVSGFLLLLWMIVLTLKK